MNVTADFSAIGRDPDSLHGMLLMAEVGHSEEWIAQRVGEKAGKLAKLLAGARAGRVGRASAAMGDERRPEPVDFPSGLFPRKWKRDLIAALLRPDGVTTDEVTDVMVANGMQHHPGTAISDLRAELRPFRINVNVFAPTRCAQHTYRIAGAHAWRMQKIIANGWMP